MSGERTDWNPVLRSELDQQYWAELRRFVAEERRAHTVYPPQDLESSQPST